MNGNFPAISPAAHSDVSDHPEMTPSGRVYLADTPQRFVPAAEIDEIMRALGILRD